MRRLKVLVQTLMIGVAITGIAFMMVAIRNRRRTFESLAAQHLMLADEASRHARAVESSALLH
jgi:hypothetical protein